MPTMGRPNTEKAHSYGRVTMAPRRGSAPDPNSIEVSSKDKARLLNKLTGFKEKNDLYADVKTHNKMGKDEFLKLLTVQLQNQDPTKPMEQNKMAAELAQFSQLEQLSNLNTKFDQFNQNKNVEDKFYGASFVGKEIVTSGTSLKFNGAGTDADILFALEKPANKVLLRIFDSKHNIVSEQWRENIGRGHQTISWDGLSLDGQTAVAGEYTVGIFAWNTNSEPIGVETKAKGQVESVYFENGETVLLVDGKKVFLRDVDSFHTSGKMDKYKASQAPKAPKVNVGSSMGGVLSGLQKRAASMGVQQMPLAQQAQTKVNLNKLNNAHGVNAYKQQTPTTGITDVYDVE